VIYKILRVLLLSVIIAIVIAVVVLIFIVLGILGGGNLDFSGISFHRSGKKKKKKQTQK
jgi:threonine/homoserine/homoserine lactone efflux protein